MWGVNTRNTMKQGLIKRYFSYLAKSFPVLCASGDMRFLPAAARADGLLDRLEDFSPRAVERHVSKLNGFLADFNKVADRNIGVEHERAVAMATNVSGVLLELSTSQSWRKDPSLYLKIAFTGIHHALSLPAKSERIRTRRTIKRLRAVPEFLGQVEENIETITQLSRSLAQTMIRDCARYLQQISAEPALTADPKSGQYLQECLNKLKEVDRHITTRHQVDEVEGPDLQTVLDKGFGTDKTVQDIFEMADAQWRSALGTLKALAAELGVNDWRDAYADYLGPGEPDDSSLTLFENEVARLRSFFKNKEFSGLIPDLELTLAESPLYMASLRRAAHYCAPLAAGNGDSARLMVIPHAFSGRGFREDTSRLKRARKESMFIAAQETVPGSHLMASRRLLSDDLLISQLRNPLVADGWRAFGEQLLMETGYLKTPMERLVHQRRRLCRAARCIVDTGLATGHADQDRCMDLMEQSGFSKEEALHELRSIRLAPGSQVGPVLGKVEIENLRTVSQLETPQFCKEFLDGGESPFSMTHLKLKAGSH